GEVTYGAEFLRWFAEEAVRQPGRFRHAPSAEEAVLTVARPVGPSLLITPWNFPLSMGTRKIGPALAAGCTVVRKPAPKTPLRSGEVTYGAEFLRWFAEEAVRQPGRFRHAPSAEEAVLTVARPVGPSLLITPWNFPLSMGTRKIGPALAAGCTVVLKPAQKTPL